MNEEEKEVNKSIVFNLRDTVEKDLLNIPIQVKYSILHCLNLIDRQQKELELEKEKNKKVQLVMTDYLPKDVEMVLMTKADFERNFNFISKDKIRELLKEYKDTGYYEVERVLEELLKEE